MTAEDAIHPKVFISYSHDSLEHEDRVLELSDRLREDALDCILDQYEISVPEGWPRWMDRQIRTADFVLMICTPTYYRRVMGEEGPGKGLGVQWESNAIYQYIYNAGTMNTRFIPVLLEGTHASDIPIPWQGVPHYYPTTEEGYEKLYRRLTNQSYTPRPQLGVMRHLPPRQRKQSFSNKLSAEYATIPTLSTSTVLKNDQVADHVSPSLPNVSSQHPPYFTGSKTTLMQNYVGKNHTELLSWLSQIWLKEGPPVSFVQGFSGVGKTSLARNLRKISGYPSVIVNMPDAGSDQTRQLFLRLATELDIVGFDAMANAVNTGTPLSRVLERELRNQILIVVDEFQLALDASGRSINEFAHLLESIANRPQLPGRVLLLSNRLVEEDKVGYPIRTLSALEPEAAELLLDMYLREDDRSQEVPLEFRRDVVNWLGCNPRAIQVLVGSLKRDSLDALIGLSPKTWKMRDREVSPELIERLERALLERTLSYLKAETNSLLRRLSVHREAVKQAAIQIGLPVGVEYATIRDDLINCFLMEQHSGWFTLNPIAREISLQRLRKDPDELKRAHSSAADYYMRYFSSKNIQSSGHLSGYFVEVSYHLVQARREMDLSLVAGPFGNHLATLFKGNSSIPNEQAELNERIAVLSAVLEEAPDEKGLQLYLARLYQARGDSGDLRKALACLQRATGPNAPALCWMLRIQLEKQFKGPERALEVCREGIDMLPVDKDVAQLYINYADLLAQAGKVEEAINSLKEAIGKIPPDKALADLYQRCADLLARAGKVEEAINLFKEAIGKIPPDKGLADLYVNYADLLARAGKVEEAINLFKEAIGKIPPSMGMSNTLFQHMLLLCAATRVLTSLENLFSEIDTKEIDPRQVVLWNVFRFQLQGAWKLAAETAHQGSTRFPTYLMLYTQEAFSWLCSGDAKEADVTLQRFPRPIMLDKGNVTGWLKALVALKNGDMQMARECLSSYLGWPPIDQKEITIDLLLRLWDTPPKSQEDYDIAYYYPRLPPSITGLPNEVARIPYGPPVLYD